MKKTTFLAVLMITVSAVVLPSASLSGDLNGGGRDQDPVSPILNIIPGTIADTTTAAYGVPNPVLQNDFNIFFNPSQLMNYGTAYGEIFRAGEVWGGATIRLPWDMKFGLFLGRPYNGKAGNYLDQPGGDSINFGSINIQTGIGGTTWLPAMGNLSPLIPINHADIMLGKKFSSSFSAGVKFTYADNTEEASRVFTPVSTNEQCGGIFNNKQTVADHHITAGFVFNDFIIFSSLDLSVDMGLSSLANEYTETQFTNKRFSTVKIDSDNGPAWGFTLRPVLPVGENLLITVLNLNLIDTSTKFSWQTDGNGDGQFTNSGVTERDQTGTFKDTQTLFLGLMAFHTKPTKSLKIIYSAGFSYDKRDQEAMAVSKGTNDYKESLIATTTFIPVAISLEHQLFPWFKTRFGVSKQILYNEKSESADEQGRPAQYINEYDTKDNPTDVSVSAGIGLVPARDFEIDLTLNVVGYSFDILLSRASLKYHF